MLGKVILELPELNVIVPEVSARMISNLVELSFAKYIEKDIFIKALGEVQ